MIKITLYKNKLTIMSVFLHIVFRLESDIIKSNIKT